MGKRKVIIAGNWKMNKNRWETRVLLNELMENIVSDAPGCEVIVAPPFTAIFDAVDSTRGTPIRVSGQNLHWEDQGAYTGEVSAQMLKQAGCSHVIIGHSERRQFFGETDETVNWKIRAAYRRGLVPIFCLGETLEQREGGKTFEKVKSQLIGGMDGIEVADPSEFIVAYEPVWAIGTGRTATPDQAQEVHDFLRRELGVLRGNEFAGEVRILYGGSVKPDNTRSLMNCTDIDGFLVGGASLKAKDFLGIIREAT
jgi:triosephosphate isomerase (TIM)